MNPVRIAIAGVGKIARDQHLPTIAADPGFELVATVDPHSMVENVPGFASVEDLAVRGPRVDAISICTPPVHRHAVASAAIGNGWHVMLEKPSTATVAESEDLVARADEAGVTLFTAWHSRAAPGVEAAREWLTGRHVRSVRIDWLENIREWHPGQEWILEPGGFGVFDPGINALSIITTILPEEVQVERAIFEIPAGRACPIAAALHGKCGEAPFEAKFDFLKSGDQVWTIDIETDAGILSLSDGGASCTVDGHVCAVSRIGEYAALYGRFRSLIASRSSDVDLIPLRIVESAASIAEHRQCPPFRF